MKQHPSSINAEKPREFWVEATGKQDDDEDGFVREIIDLTIPGEDRWIYTSIQTVPPGDNSVAKKKKWLHLVEFSAYEQVVKERDEYFRLMKVEATSIVPKLIDEINEAKEILKQIKNYEISKLHKDTRKKINDILR